uniref:Ovostatin homolog 2-like n=1 Tax=Saimiri boliviensis boliviensis TaxID=39432 RepID=A0A2K6T1K0_SAIBB
MIFQWQNVTSFRNITQLSFQLISEPMFGDYWIVVKRNSGKTVTHRFAVKRYVLPKFEVKVSAPHTVTISDDEFQVDVCAKYTFGQPVQGKTQIRVCREYYSSSNCEKNDNEICEQFAAQVQIWFTLLCSSFLTGVQISEMTSVFITQLLGTVNFENMDTFYRRGISYFGTLKFLGPDNVPMVNKLLQLELNDEFIGNYTTDENGEAQFSINTSDIFDPEFNLKATYIRPKSCYLPSWLTPQYLDAHFLVSRFYSRTNSFLKIVPEPKRLECNQQKVVTVHYALNSEAYKDDSSVNFFYLVTWNGNFSFPVSISADLAPAAVLFVYTLHPSGEIVADSIRFQIDKCFKHKVIMKFSKEQGLPGSNASLYLQAAPDSLCALRAVDKSIVLLESEQLSAESVYNMVPNIELFGYFYHGLNLEDGKADPCVPQKDMFYNGLYYTPVSNYGDGDIYNIVRVRSLRILENILSQILAIIQTVRTNFPETWMWDLVSVDSSGSATLSFRIPDTITQWEANGFCVNGDVGFGISSTSTLEVFQPFFVEIASPFSVVQNEQFDLIVNVFNYLNTCVEVSCKVNITVVAESKRSSACPNEGIEQQKLNWKDTVQYGFPLFLFLGDVLGLVTRDLVTVQMPYGSGEQNAVLLASDTYVLDYLKSTGQLTEEVQSKAFFLLSNGYQRQLSFKNSDGSYSIFWQQNQKGSVWLSALIFKTLERMKKYVLIDENVQKQTLIWLSSQQKRSGCFKNDGQLFNPFPPLRSALFCLEATLYSGVTNGYTHAILAYAFALAGKEEQAESLLQTLDQSATKTNNVIYWERERKPETEEFPSFIPRAPSAQTEKTCYVLLAVVSQKTPDLVYATKIVQWLAQQMNSHGGFSSTQDTTVCLLAITRYMKLTFSKNKNTVTIRSEGSSDIFEVNSDNRLLVQGSELTKAPGLYTVDVEGQGCTFIQVTEICLRGYTGIHNKSNMVVIDVKMLSGFTPVMSSIEEVNNRSLIFQHKHSYIEYKDEMNTDSFTFSVEQTNLVFNIQPAPVTAYDYYEKGRQPTAMP